MKTRLNQLCTATFVVGLMLVWVVTCLGETDLGGGVSGQPAKPGSRSVHQALFAQDKYPSATACRTCHPGHYREWSVSQHAYAQLSPVFNAMQATMVELSSGTLGDFCIRCHTPTGMSLGEPLIMSTMDRAPVSREGVTCIVCHRVEQPYGKVSGRRALTEGGVLTPVKGPSGNAELQRVLSEPGHYRVVTNETVTGRKIHVDAEPFFQLTSSDFCGSCHDVTMPNGFRLEEAFSEFKNSPAAHRGESCQDCHMGLEPGKKSGYRLEPAAVIGGMPTEPRRRTNHMFPGPDHSIIHPGLFPHNPRAAELASLRDWLTFDHEAGWGTDPFEKNVGEEAEFPSRWKSADDRYDARGIVEEQLALLDEVREQRLALLRQGYQLGAVKVRRADHRGLEFAVEVRNGTDGHSVPTGFDAERPVYLQVVVTDAEGEVVFRSGDLDPSGDLRDLHSAYVRSGGLPLDKQLFSLQSRFLVTNLRGGEREEVLAVNRSFDPLPFMRPEPYSTVLTGRPRSTRIQRRGIAPGGVRWADYQVKGGKLTGRAPYRIEIRLKAAMVPVNLISAISSRGFDFGMSAGEVAEQVVSGHLTLWERTILLGLEEAKEEAVAGRGVRDSL